jgi:hypothetical protein
MYIPMTAIFIIVTDFCFPHLETFGLRVAARFTRDISFFTVYSSSTNSPSARCVAAADVVCKDVDVFGTKSIPLDQI